MARATCGVQLKDRISVKDLILTLFLLDLNENIDHLAMANSVHWYGHVLSRENGYLLRWALKIEVEGHRKKWRLKGTWMKQVNEDSMMR